MKTLKNKVQLIGNVGEHSKSHCLESGKKVTRFTLATNEYFRRDGEKVQQTDWHYLVAWGNQAEFVEQYVQKSKEIAIEGKLTSRSYENAEGQKQYITDVIVTEILLLGTAKTN